MKYIKNNDKYKSITAASVTIGEVYGNGGLEVSLVGAPSEWSISNLVLPPCENFPKEFECSGRTANNAKAVLRHLRKVLYLATNPLLRRNIYHEGRDLASRRQLTLLHHTLGRNGEAAMDRLVHLENILISLIEFYGRGGSAIRLSERASKRHSEHVGLLKFARVQRQEEASARSVVNDLREFLRKERDQYLVEKSSNGRN